MRTTLTIDDQLLRRAKQHAAADGVTLGRYVEDALRERLTTPRRNPQTVELPVFHGGKLRAGIDRSSNRDLYDALDDAGGSGA